MTLPPHSPPSPGKEALSRLRNFSCVKAVLFVISLLLASLTAFEGSPAPGPSTPANDHWAFKMPVADERSIDELIEANLNKSNLTPVPQASRKVLVQRTFFVLTGLLPAAKELRDALDDPRPDWLARLVDDLLARPAFGERWARHWLDIARYADTRGAALPRNENFPFAWTYRDWVIRAFDTDLPYHQFLQRQIAADLLDLPREELAALGFLTIGRGYQGGQNHLVIADRIDVATRSTMGLTVACARCHDHKSDPIPTADYYALYGVFNSSFVPPQLPAIADPSPSPAARTYRGELRKKALAVHDHLAKSAPAYQKPDDLFNFAISPEVRKQFHQKEREKFQTLVGEIEEFKAASPFAIPRAMVLREKAKPHDPRIHERGNPRAKGEPVPRAFLSLFRGQEEHFTEGSGRLEFARRLTDDRNPLTARVWANRVWMHLTGTPLVDSPGDFGPQTPPPLQLELLDHLALFLQDKDWSTKALIRHIMTSQTWQRSSLETPELIEQDPANHSYARANRRRKDLEAWRDSALQVSGRLVTESGGRPFELDKAPYEGRRTIYARVRRGFLPAIMKAFDFPGSEEATMRRSQTITPTQALYLMNSPFLLGEARALARNNPSIDALYQAVLQRKPTPIEKEVVQDWLARTGARSTAGGWDYGYLEKDSLIFKTLPHYAGGQWRGKEPLPDPTHGWLHWTERGGHPESDRHATLKWSASETETISIAGTFHLPSPKGNGAIARILGPDGKTLAEWTVEAGTKSPTKIASLKVRPGEPLFFVVDSRGDPSFNSFEWSPRLSGKNGLITDARADFSGPGLPPHAQLAQSLLLSNEFFYLD